jgi:ArsR family transcriptional regulator
MLQNDDGSVEQAAQLFNFLSDPTRLRILFLLDQEGEMTATEIHCQLDLGPSGTKQQLARMRQERLVEPRRMGRRIYYRFVSPSVRNLLRASGWLVEHAKGTETAA